MKHSSGSKPQPQCASDPESNAIRFCPRPYALHSATQGRAAPGYQSPAALLGVFGGQNLLPTGSPSWGSRIGRAKKFCAQAPAMSPEPAWPLSAEAPSHGTPKTSFWQLHSAKGNSPRAAKHRLNAPQIQKATQAVLAPGPTLSIAQSKAGLPLAPWALLHYWGSPAPET